MSVLSLCCSGSGLSGSVKGCSHLGSHGLGLEGNYLWTAPKLECDPGWTLPRFSKGARNEAFETNLGYI